MTESAFPLVINGFDYSTGLSKREYFASMALQGYISMYDKGFQPDYDYAAIQAVSYADALIQALNGEPG
jgi:hypothetical protein